MATSTRLEGTAQATPSDSVVLIEKDISLSGVGKFNESITYFDKTLSSDLNNVLALTQKGNALGGLGKYTQTIVYYSKALSI